jgi:hypothetical protein
MELLLDTNSQQITKGQKLLCVKPDSKGKLEPGHVYICAGRRNSRVALKGFLHGYAGWRFTIRGNDAQPAAVPIIVPRPR